jgi:hypothetical protein
MKNKDFAISSTLIWMLILINLVLIALGSIAKVQEWGMASFLLYASYFVYVPCWIIILSEMLRKKIFNQWFWVLSMFILPVIASFFYMLQRDKLTRLGEKLEK